MILFLEASVSKEKSRLFKWVFLHTHEGGERGMLL